MAQFAQAIAGDGTQGGYSVPDGFLNRIVVRMKAFGGVQKLADSITTGDGQPLRWPSVDDTANSAVIATEGSAASGGGADLVFGSVTLGAYSFDATGTGNLPLLVSKELLQDSAIPLENFISDRLAERLGRKMAAEFANGTGSNEPLGLFAKSADVMTATTFFAAVQEHFFQVDQAYRDDNIDGDVSWLMSDTNLAKVLGSVDGNGRPLFIPAANSSGAAGPSGSLLGYPVYLDQAAGTNVAFGDMKRGFIIRYVRGVQIDVDPYTAIKSRQVAYHAWARADSNVQDANAYSVSDYTSVTADAAS
jgi:HK97 family phage major capsid protein